MTAGLLACGDDKSAGATSEGTTDDTTDDTIGMSSTPTTSGTGDATTGEVTTGEVTTGEVTTGEVTTVEVTTGEVTTGEVTTGGVTTGAPVDPDVTVCRQFCDRRPECGLPERDEQCMQDCLAELDVPVQHCADSKVDMFECFAMLACAQYVPLANEGDPGPCEGLVDQQAFVCSLDGCDAGGGIDQGSGCSFTLTCPDEPFRSMECDEVTCTCFVDARQVASCPVEDACVDVFASALRAEACCGF